MPMYAKKNGVRRVRGAVMIDGKSRRKWFPDDSLSSYRAAAAWEQEQKEKAGIKQSQTRTESCSVYQWQTEYLSYCQPRVSKKTYLEKQGAAKRLLAFVPDPHMPVKELRARTVIDFLALQGEERSGNASNKDRKNLSTGWEWGRRFVDGFPKEFGNLFAQVDKLPEERMPRYIPPEEDFWAVMDLAEGQDRVMLLTFLHLALRRGEAFRMQWADIDFGNCAVKIGTRKRRGGSMEYDWLPLTSELKKELLWWWENRPLRRTEYVFTQIYDSPSRWHSPGKPFQHRMHWMRKMCARAGVKPFGFHAVRHLSATILFKAGYKLAVIQRILRHKSPSTTERYLHRLGLMDFEIGDEVFAAPKRGKLVPLVPPEDATQAL